MAKKKKAAKAARRSSKQEELLRKLRHFIRTEGVRYLDDPNINSIGIGYKILSDGTRTDQICLQFTVNSKPEDSGISLEELDTERIPKEINVNGESVPTDVIQREFRPSFRFVEAEETDPRKLRVDPIQPGVSVSHFRGTAGTLGMIVFDRATGAPCMLSNWHVLHGANGFIGDIVVQPGPHDDNNIDHNVAGILIRSHLGAAGDCAIARIEQRNFVREILDLGVAPARLAEVDLDDVVIKSGRTTGVTRGVVRRVDVMARIPYAGVGPHDIGGFEIGLLPDADPSFEISMGGDSGSVWLIADGSGATDIVAGLHFAGEGGDNPDEHAIACYARSVFKKLDITLEPIEIEEPAGRTGELGFDLRFLSDETPTPRLTTAHRRDAFTFNGSPLIPYTHFSVCLSKKRGLARYVAWNIDGGRILKLSRDGIPFRTDDRVPEEFQHDNSLYANNDLDRGHLARRADLTWGSMAEASRANIDSFFYTNISPQHARFNQSRRHGLWGELENALFEDVQVEDLRISCFAGPVFRDDDPEHRGVKIPRDYWKLLAFKDTADDRFKVKAFLLTQRDLLTDLEALELDEFRLYQISLDKLREDTDLDFSALKRFDTLPEDLEAEVVEALPRDVREVTSRRALFV